MSQSSSGWALIDGLKVTKQKSNDVDRSTTSFTYVNNLEAQRVL